MEKQLYSLKQRFAAFFALMAFAFLTAVAPAFAVRTDVTVINPVSINAAIAADSADFVWTAADVGNSNSCTLTGRELLLVNNTGGSPYTVTITSAADELGRTGDITTYSLAAGEFAVFGPFPMRGWRQTGGKLYFAGSNAAVKFAVIVIPGTI